MTLATRFALRELGLTIEVKRPRAVRSIAVVLCGVALSATASDPPIERFIEATSPDDRIARSAMAQIAAAWKDGYAAMFVDMARLMRRLPPRVSQLPEIPFRIDDDPSAQRDDSAATLFERENSGSPIRRRLVGFLERQTHHSFGGDLNRWREWMWTLPYDPHPEYAVFKGLVYAQLDPRFRNFFPAGVPATIRLDEIDWGGVRVNGIPPLRNPRVLPASAATYLGNSNVVFGLLVNGEARAYPKRILAWHEMATDRLGGVELTIVYCTLCGTVIPFESRAGGRAFLFGTSGLLYRSNKLMFDEETKSLWSTFEGVPVVGPLVGTGVALVSRPTVTTTWKEWRLEHPDTTVLSLETGYERDYAEGAAYRDYFSTDRLMFSVSKTDARLRNKAEVLVMRLTDRTQPGLVVPVAIDTQLLRKHPVFAFSAAHDRFVVVTTPGGANRVYRTDAELAEQRSGPTIVDTTGRTWQVTETSLSLRGSPGVEAPRLSAQRAFWFGWYAQFPQTILIK
ncbi:MAG: DUF3179 domain-containing protein [Acidobacteria bacterium]|nr:DUF3179 domain-containing protein [Acidobacteriota bacterium]